MQRGQRVASGAGRMGRGLSRASGGPWGMTPDAMCGQATGPRAVAQLAGPCSHPGESGGPRWTEVLLMRTLGSKPSGGQRAGWWPHAGHNSGGS